MFDLVIRDGRFALSSGTVAGWLAVAEGTIAALGDGPAPAARKTFDARNAVVLPGGIDPHVHFRDPGFTHKEDFATGSAAAAAGGVTTVFDMPNTKPAVLSTDVFEAKRAMAETKSIVDFGLFAAADPTNVVQLRSLAVCGAIAFKVFMSAPAHPPPQAVLDDGLLWQIFAVIGETGRPVCVHAENDALVRYFTARVEATGRHVPRLHLEARPTICETEAISRAILLAGDAGARLHVCHMSSGAGADLVRAAKGRGVRVTAETGPQNLLLDETHYERLGPRLKMKPPIRTAADSAKLWEAVRDGIVDMLATDHAPHTAEEKLKDDFFEAASGIIGVETTLPLMLTQVGAGRLTLAQLSRLRSEMPARVFGLYPHKGTIQVGADADLVVVDMQREWTIQSEGLHSRSRLTPFEGWPVKGAVIATLVRGQIVYHEGQIIGPPIGQLVRPLEI